MQKGNDKNEKKRVKKEPSPAAELRKEQLLISYPSFVTSHLLSPRLNLSKT